MKKKWVAMSLLAAMAVLCLTGCGEKPAEKEDGQQSERLSLQLSVEDYPVMDGSTANLPMMAEVMCFVLHQQLHKQGLTAAGFTALIRYNNQIVAAYFIPIGNLSCINVNKLLLAQIFYPC
mgnify:CR=1 FL=1